MSSKTPHNTYRVPLTRGARRGLLLALACALVASAAEPTLEKSALFEAEQGGYKLYRIPGVAVTAKGTVLAYCEARRFTGSDWDTIDLLLRRSTDGGRTFSAPVQIGKVDGKIERSPVALERKQGKPTDVTYNNPVAIADRNGTVHVLFAVEYLRVFYMRSDDDGVTFSKPVEITNVLEPLRKDYAWRAVATGPGHGIQLRNGRLVAPVWIALGTQGSGHGPSTNTTIYSDDHGKTWHAGSIAIPNSDEFPNANETTITQLADGRVMMNVRCNSRRNRRAIAISKDGAHNWTAQRFQEDLPDPICAAGLVRLSTRKDGGKNRLLFSNPNSLTRRDGKDIVAKDRQNLTIRLSYDEATSWPIARVLEPGRAAYSDLATLPDGTVLCFYENSETKANGVSVALLTLARFSLDWLTEGQDTLKVKQKRH